MVRGSAVLGVISPVDAGGLIERAVITLIQDEHIKGPVLSRGMVHQGDIFFSNHKLPIESRHNATQLMGFQVFKKK